MTTTDEALATALDHGTCALSDAMDTLGIAGVPAGLRWLSGAGPVGGRAVTVELGPAGPDRPARHLCTAAVAASGPGQVIVVSHPGGQCAGWGGLLSLAASTRGVEGVVIDGPARDVDEAQALGFAVVGREPTPVTARTRIVEVGWNDPVRLGGVVVTPGDIVVADANGVVIVPAARAGEVLARSASIVAREAAMASDVRAGVPVTEVMGRRYEELS